MNRKNLVEMLLKVSIIIFVLAVTCSIFVSLAYTFEKTNIVMFMISGSLFVATIINMYLLYEASNKEHDLDMSKDYCNKTIKEYELYKEIANYLHMYYPDRFKENALSNDDLIIFTTLTDAICGCNIKVYSSGSKDRFKKLLKNLEGYGMQHTEFYKIVKEIVDEDCK